MDRRYIVAYLPSFVNMPLHFCAVATTRTNLHLAVVMGMNVMCAMLPLFDVSLSRNVATVGKDAPVNTEAFVLCKLVQLAGTL